MTASTLLWPPCAHAGTYTTHTQNAVTVNQAFISYTIYFLSICHGDHLYKFSISPRWEPGTTPGGTDPNPRFELIWVDARSKLFEEEPRTNILGLTATLNQEKQLLPEVTVWSEGHWESLATALLPRGKHSQGGCREE